MKLLILSTFSLLTLLSLQANAKKFMRCELAQLLDKKYKFDRSFLAHWICLIEHESEMNTALVKKLPNDSASYGLFQINSKEWCREGRKGGICDAKCEDYIDDDISDDVVCANKIFKRDGFKHWEGWRRFCRDAHKNINISQLCPI